MPSPWLKQPHGMPTFKGRCSSPHNTILRYILQICNQSQYSFYWHKREQIQAVLSNLDKPLCLLSTCRSMRCFVLQQWHRPQTGNTIRYSNYDRLYNILKYYNTGLGQWKYMCELPKRIEKGLQVNFDGEFELIGVMEICC